MSDSSITVTLDSKLVRIFTVAGAAIGAVLAFIVGPLATWMVNQFDMTFLPLQLLDRIPMMWSVPLLTLLGALGGWIIFMVWDEGVGRVMVDPEKIRIDNKSGSAEYSRDEISQIFLDKDELVLVDKEARELSRTSSDSWFLVGKLADAFGAFDYPWAGGEDPREAEFADWVDRSPELEENIHALLRARRRALTDEKAGEAESLREELAAQGIVVRDRDEKQQYRRLPAL
ncbi:hypothetical protein HGQ17_00350 [Nesterenkonia sp. MY13]|uniref:DUF308 domain-containing protein n=1 Tax=Nesterenkonia sedimenti TaxID=1463632 RepID=A0A7X8TH59_9MICC|nr:hypothetical protein [Nesterenkonia sedimenti]NLS08479.1 hypothetical protein [Nesterenkonia sedimenti]